MAERAALVVRMREIEVAISDIRTRIRAKPGRDLPANIFERWNRLRRERAQVEGRLTELKAWLRANPLGRDFMPDGKPVASLDAYDLQNALVEPQDLLHRLYVAFQAKTRVLGVTEADRALLDTVRDYLRRQGIVL